jgi:hypothetical protein
LSLALVVAAFAAIAGVTAGVRNARLWGPRGRAMGHGVVGIAAALLVFVLQSVSVGASLVGAIIAVAVGGMTLLALAFVGSS